MDSGVVMVVHVGKIWCHRIAVHVVAAVVVVVGMAAVLAVSAVLTSVVAH